MLTASAEYRAHWAESSECALRVTFDWADGTTTVMTGDDLMMGGVEVTKASTPSGSFDVGGVVVGTSRVTLNNLDGRLDDLTFDGAEVAVEVGVELAGGGTEWVLVGTYDAVQPESYGATVAVELQDPLGRLDRDFSDVVVGYPCSLGELLGEMCTACGIVTASASFPNSTVRVPAAPSADCSCADVVGWIGRAAGCFAICDPRGRLAMRWYDGESDPIAVTAISSLTVTLDDVLVTGVRVQASEGTNASGERVDGEASTYGSEGYVLDLGQNPLVPYGGASACASRVGDRVVGMHFRPFSASAVGNPLWEPGDPVTVTDSRGVTHGAWLTSLTWRAGAYEQMACDAKPPVRNAGRARTSDAARAIMQVRERVAYEQTQRELAVASLQRQIDTAGGTYRTEETLPDGSTIIYVHDQPTLAESTVVWKLTAEALGLSTDGGVTYPYGLDVTGTAILDRIYAIGIDADYIRTGTVRGRQSESSWDLDTGVFSMTRRLVELASADTYTCTRDSTQRLPLYVNVDATHTYMIAFTAPSGLNATAWYCNVLRSYTDPGGAGLAGRGYLVETSSDGTNSRYVAWGSPGRRYTNTQVWMLADNYRAGGSSWSLDGQVLTDIRFYRLATDGDGVISFGNSSEDDKDVREGSLYGATLEVALNTLRAILEPDLLRFDTLGTGAECGVVMGSTRKVGYIPRLGLGMLFRANNGDRYIAIDANGNIVVVGDRRAAVSSLPSGGVSNQVTCPQAYYDNAMKLVADGNVAGVKNGTVMVGTVSAGYDTSVTVTFTESFDSDYHAKPRVVVTPRYGATTGTPSSAFLYLSYFVSGVSTTGFTIDVRNGGSTSVTNLYFDWVAVSTPRYMTA